MMLIKVYDEIARRDFITRIKFGASFAAIALSPDFVPRDILPDSQSMTEFISFATSEIRRKLCVLNRYAQYFPCEVEGFCIDNGITYSIEGGNGLSINYCSNWWDQIVVPINLGIRRENQQVA